MMTVVLDLLGPILSGRRDARGGSAAVGPGVTRWFDVEDIPTRGITTSAGAMCG